ncbi:MAG: hypothetical protein ACLFVT_06195, partial [Syntrophobacteria bacterium]
MPRQSRVRDWVGSREWCPRHGFARRGGLSLLEARVSREEIVSQELGGRDEVIDIQETIQRLQAHLEQLTVTIGERSVRLPENLDKTASYIGRCYRELGLPVETESYGYRHYEVAN